jgi:uncharacterized protein
MHTKPSKPEEEYFKKHNAELIAQGRKRLDEERVRAERSSHYMKCPKCGADLAEREYHHVKIDVCPDCNGMWLDAGELELIEKIDHSHVGHFMRALFGLEK